MHGARSSGSRALALADAAIEGDTLNALVQSSMQNL